MITVKNLSYTYPGTSSSAVEDVSFEVRPGEIFGFLGPSGAGKSTSQKVLIGLLPGYSGSISVLGTDLSKWGATYYEHIGVGFELPNHYLKLTALENLQFFASFYRRATADPMALLEKVGLADAARKRVETYSKGMKMRLNFIRALLHDPEVLFFDEPTSGLDPGNGRILKDLILEEKARGKTIFLTTHNMYDADELCDRVGFMVDGRLKLVDAPRDLKLREGKRRVRVEYNHGGRQSQEFDLDGVGENSAFLALLKHEGLEAIHTTEPTLETLFIQKTGRELT